MSGRIYEYSISMVAIRFSHQGFIRVEIAAEI